MVFPTSSPAVADRIFGRGRARWFIPDDVGAWTMQPLLDGPCVYFSRNLPLSPSGSVIGEPELRALHRDTGATVWKGGIPSSAHNAAVAGDVVGTVWGSLAMFGRASGVPTRVFRYDSTSLSGNVVADGGLFYVGSHDGHVLAVDAATGSIQWDRDLAGGSSTTVFGLALSGDALAVTLKRFRKTGSEADSGIVAVLDRTTGAQRWRLILEGAGDEFAIVEAPVLATGLVVVITQGFHVQAFDLQTGAARWRQNVSMIAGNYTSRGLTACDDLVIAPTGDLGLVALDAVTGAVRWRLGDLDIGSLWRLECSFNTILVLGSSMQVLDARTGALRAHYPVREPDDWRREFYITSATRDENSLYVGSTFGYARVIAP
jgi:putative pyrroloquinoline-quinone binding quinoprotein